MIFYSDRTLVSFRERLNPWVLVRLLPNMKRITVGQFRSRSDADGHLQIVRRLIPQAQFVVMFDPGLPVEHQAKH